MAFIPWSEDYSVGVKEIDHQHKYFVSLLSSLYDAIMAGADRKTLGFILDDLVAYKSYHFATEEKYFDLFNYPDSLEHKEAHRDLSNQVNTFKEQFVAGKKDISVDLVDFMEDWLVKHLNHMDKKYTAFFHEHGLN